MNIYLMGMIAFFVATIVVMVTSTIILLKMRQRILLLERRLEIDSTDAEIVTS